jgi:hypothetical protein
MSHSILIRNAIITIENLKAERRDIWETDRLQFETIFLEKDPFLFHHYYEVHMTLLRNNNEWAIPIIWRLLRELENSEFDNTQYDVSDILKEFYYTDSTPIATRPEPVILIPVIEDDNVPLIKKSCIDYIRNLFK